jgi:hypothetical protein
LGTKTLSGKRIKLLLYLINYNNMEDNLGRKEFEEEKDKKEKREQLRSIRAVIHHEVTDAGEQRTVMNKVAKKLMRLTLAALLADVGEALSMADGDGCFVKLEPQRPTTSLEAMVYFLTFIITALIVLVVRVSYMVYKYHNLANYHRNMVRQVRSILRRKKVNEENAYEFVEKLVKLKLQGLVWSYAKVENQKVQTFLKTRR